MDEYRKLSRQPLVFALAEFRYSQILQIGEYIPQIQEAIRRSYPLIEVLQEQSLQATENSLNVLHQTRWAFLSADQADVVTVDQDRLIFFTTNYQRFGAFTRSCFEVLRPLEDIVGPDLLLRIGLRYGDLIRIADDEKLEDYVDPYFDYPKLAKPLGTPEYQHDEVGIRTDIGRLLIRSIYGSTNLVALPDIKGLPGLPQPDAESSNRIVLDFDHVWSVGNEPVKFDCGRIEDILTKLHDTAREAFWRITTDEAKDNKWS